MSVKKVLNRTVRKYIYVVAAAAVPVLVYFGLLDIEASPIILPFLLALLNLTPKDVEVQQEHEEDLSEY